MKTSPIKNLGAFAHPPKAQTRPSMPKLSPSKGINGMDKPKKG